jgi:hypothetical protein
VRQANNAKAVSLHIGVCTVSSSAFDRRGLGVGRAERAALGVSSEQTQEHRPTHSPDSLPAYIRISPTTHPTHASSHQASLSSTSQKTIDEKPPRSDPTPTVHKQCRTAIATKVKLCDMSWRPWARSDVLCPTTQYAFDAPLRTLRYAIVLSLQAHQIRSSVSQTWGFPGQSPDFIQGQASDNPTVVKRPESLRADTAWRCAPLRTANGV